MKLVDQVIVLHSGIVIDKGTFMELNQKEALKEIIERQSNAVQETDLYHEQIPSTKDHFPDKKTFKSMEIPDEDRKIGALSCKLYWNYLTAGEHPIALAGLFLIFLLSQGKSQRTVCINESIHEKEPNLETRTTQSDSQSKSFRKTPTSDSNQNCCDSSLRSWREWVRARNFLRPAREFFSRPARRFCTRVRDRSSLGCAGYCDSSSSFLKTLPIPKSVIMGESRNDWQRTIRSPLVPEEILKPFL